MLGLRFRLTAAVAVVAASCAPQVKPEPENLPASPPVIVVTLEEYRFELPARIPAGRVVFRVRNPSDAAHRPALLPLGDLPPLEQQLRGEERAAVAPFAGTRTRAPGATGAFAVVLEPDARYGFICFIRDDVVGSHALKGMYHEFRTPAGP